MLAPTKAQFILEWINFINSITRNYENKFTLILKLFKKSWKLWKLFARRKNDNIILLKMRDHGKGEWQVAINDHANHANWKHAGEGLTWRDASKDDGLFHSVSSACVTTTVIKPCALFGQRVTPLLMKIWKSAWWVLIEIASWVNLLIFGLEYPFNFRITFNRRNSV